ncbi:acetyl-CoA:L-glutamate N-acetyltransferase SCDLUD_003582 [Saccharomycodes ludwigii]|uniref:acetyl-CoA:L-glutamate N-acetyltransferase n=1 Tax=Saccharomycodes ludwigii TaxID=36035 RepID=UPI001E84637B|nr:hypothetical protein SCDLUD_003582 [Saccharomycodes ludwigii]KAH3900590.1 hypothetical protein SCDLUD_003582 [Saccharomycodes ludwigii]
MFSTFSKIYKHSTKLKPFISKTHTFKKFYQQPNAQNKELILSVLNSTATKREAKDYLKKCSADNKKNACIIILKDLLLQPDYVLDGFSSTIKNLKMLGINPIFVISEHGAKETSSSAANLLDRICHNKELKTCFCPDLITRKKSFEYRLSYPLYNEILKHGIIPILEPYIFDEINSKRNLTTSFPDYIKELISLLNQDMISVEKIFILNEHGGLPSAERSNYAHVFVNLFNEYNPILKQLETEKKILENNLKNKDNQPLIIKIQNTINKTRITNSLDVYNSHIENLKIMNEGLQNLPLSVTGVITTISASSQEQAKNPLLHNILTDRSLISCSLPVFKKEQNTDLTNNWYELPLQHKTIDPRLSSFFETTVLKKGINIRTFAHSKLTQYNSIGLPEKFWVKEKGQPKETGNKLDLYKFTKIINSSFQKNLDLTHYLNRIDGNIAAIIVVGDYEGIAILTYEPTTGHKNSNVKPFVYLDKFAVMPHLKGSLGISDIIFNEMFKRFPNELLWRSRRDNVVNKWYFQRSCGVVDLSVDLDNNGDIKKDNIFKLFYYGTNGGFEDPKRLQEYAQYIRDIEPSWEK